MTGVQTTHRVLLVYPPGATVRGMKDALAPEGVEVEAVENVYRAVSRFTAQPADVVVLGVAHLDDRDLDVVRILRELAPEVFILAAFPSVHRDRAVRALTCGADAYILEPFYLGEFVDIVRGGLERAARASARQSFSELDGEKLERLAGAVAHAINNPLQILELLLSEKDAGTLDTDEFRQETGRIGGVVSELLAFARRREMRPLPVDLNEIVREVVPERKERHRRVRHDLEEDLPEISADPTRLRNAIGTLAGLARIRVPEGRLTVSSAIEEDERGPAIRLTFTAPETVLAPEEIESLFRPFCGPLMGAVGLAAATARAVIEAHGGEIQITSRQGEGTDLRIRFPAPLAT